MKRIKWLGLLLLVIILCFIFMTKDKRFPEKPVNTVSLIENAEQLTRVESKDKPKIVDENVTTDPLLNHYILDNYQAKSWGYLDYFRAYQWLKQCSVFYKKGVDLDDPNVLMEPEQLQVAHELLKRCDSYAVKFDTSIKPNDKILVMLSVLENLLNELPTKNDKEQRVKESFVLTQKIKSLETELHQLQFSSLIQVSEPEWLTAEEMRALFPNTEFDDNQLYQSSSTMTLNTPQKDKEATQAAIELLLSELFAVYPSLQALLKSDDPDVFFLVKTTVEMVDGFNGLGQRPIDLYRQEDDCVFHSQINTTAEQSMLEIGIEIRNEFNNHVLIPSTALYWCALGGDCEPNSPIMTQYCLGLGGWTAETAACELDLVTFYEQSYLSTGQAQDVYLLVDWMEVYYGE